jgi:peptidoglycan-associated lipoprotein
MRNLRTIAPSLASLLAISCSTFGLSCAATKPAVANVEAVPASAPSSAGPAEAAPAARQTSSDVHISDEIRVKCGIPDADAYFAFNSASVTTRDRTPLDLVVRCFTSGPLKGHAAKLVGRADPRGPSDYNITLGQWRADAVEGYMTSRGLHKDEATTTSRGSMDATGNDERTWERDRRVDVLLAN